MASPMSQVAKTRNLVVISFLDYRSQQDCCRISKISQAWEYLRRGQDAASLWIAVKDHFQVVYDEMMRPTMQGYYWL